jgi:hypothetical protein
VKKRAVVLACLVATVPAAVVVGSALARGGGGTGSAPCTTITGDNGNVTWSPAVVWPPNHKMVPVTISWNEPQESTDLLGDSNTLRVDSITSTGVDDRGAGQPSSKQGPDYSGVGNSGSAPDGQAATVTVYVRAERSGTDKAGRTYTINLSCDSGDDSHGTSMAVVTVPHDMGNHSGTKKSSARALRVSLAR